MLGGELGPYRIEREIGSGGMGVVYLADSPDGPIALKVVHPHLVDSAGFLDRFLREARIGRQVVHPNVVRTLDSGAIDGHHFLVMEYVEGQTLRGLLREMETVPEQLCRHIGREVAKGLDAIHASGAVHRDLKPENVLITGDHVVKVMDLGIARETDEEFRLSRTGVFVGSIHYAAPEQFEHHGDVIDGRADLHALGLILYELATGAHPYPGDEMPLVIRRILSGEPRRLGEKDPQLTAFFEEVVHRLLAKDPADRFGDARSLLDVLVEGEDSRWWHERELAIRARTKRPLRRIRIPRETAVYGREREIAELRSIYDAAKEGEGRVVLIEGEAGIGKSRLVDELIGRLLGDGEDLNFLYGSYPPSGAATASGAFSRAYREQFGNEGSEPWLADTPALVPAFDALVEELPPPPGTEPLTRESLQTCFVQSTRALASERPTVVLIDDLHFAPEEGRALFTALGMGVPGHRVLLVGTTRRGTSRTWLADLDRHEHAHRISVPRLGPKDLMLLLTDTFQSEKLALDLAGRIAVKSDGNPFFVFEIIRGLREGRFITQHEDGVWSSMGAISKIDLPSSVTDLVNARVADLDEEDRNLLDVASCVGFEFDPMVVGDVLGVGQIPLMRRLAQIEKKHRLVRSAGRRFVFDHHQVQEALYEAMPILLREPYHEAVADAVEARSGAAEREPKELDGGLATDLCGHLLKAGRGDRAVRYLDAALDHLKELCLNDHSVQLATTALEIEGLLEGERRAKLLLRVANRLDLLGRRAGQEAACREAEGIALEINDPALVARAARARGLVHFRVSDLDAAEEAFRRAIDAASAAGDGKAEVAATASLGNLLRTRGRTEEALEHFERSLALAKRIGYRQGEAAATGSLALVASVRGRYEEAIGHNEKYLALAREIGDRRGVASATGNLANVLKSEGRLDEALAHTERSIELFRAIGSRQGEAVATGSLGADAWSRGRLADALSYFEQYLELSREIGDRYGEAIALVNLGPLLASLARPEDGRERLHAALAICREIGVARFEGYALTGLGGIAATLAEEEEAERRHREGLEKLRQAGDSDGIGSALASLGGLLADRGRKREAIETLGECVALGRPESLVLGRCHLARLGSSDPEEAAATAEEHDATLGAPTRLEVRWLLYRATMDPRHLEEARRHLEALLERSPESCRPRMRTEVPLYRHIDTA
jgi:predicted ATPase